VLAVDVARRLAAVRARVDAAAAGRAVTIVAVTKSFGPDAWDAAAAAGIGDIGENYAQELRAKAAEPLAHKAMESLRVHFIGRLQVNKIRTVAPLIALWQSIDRAPLIDELAKRVGGAHVLVQVNVSGEETKGGCDPSMASNLVQRARDLGVHVDGLMAVGRTGPPEDVRPGFAVLRGLCDQLSLDTCSMGMTDDFEIAIEEGATMIRIGSALFGPRPTGATGYK
jgi:pyridoxal phosphate enzyme (YggS family)